jgi:CRISPR-associated endonuclease/helicase Cas3
VVWDGEVAELRTSFHAGDVLIVPASYGGCDRFGWNPGSLEPAQDFLAAEMLPRRTWTGDDARTRRAIGLAEHLRGVGARAQRFAQDCGLGETLVGVVAEAGRLHDLGKADPRYQLMLGAELDTLLAKSGPHEVPVSRQLSGLSRGWRHEVASVAMRPDAEDLVRYLVGSHHGRGRPWLPAGPDLRLWRDAGGAQWPALARRLAQVYGYWGLAFLEALVRLADWATSADEQREPQALVAGGMLS